MLTPDAVLAGLTAIANDWKPLAIAWHIVLALALAAWVAAGWRPTSRAAGWLIAALCISVSAAAWSAGNPFNGTVFAMLGVWLFRVAATELSATPARLAAPVPLLAGLALVAFGWCYPHFVRVDHAVAYAVVSPMGLLPCPTLAAGIGLSMMLRLHDRRSWAVSLVLGGLLYGVVGVFVLRVTIDYMLLGGTLVLVADTLMPPATMRRNAVIES